ncbi:hypothetical protein [Parvularcula dongshanensis]|uniref:VPLPA-CTERM sorting domain-containing protein n=1 Tax=Parvularcula dongshanensis TaxID=1173995 RepID=A0A840I3E8_9PROT|nr:hypothetical protein [Parvularcula dongshanensis]MBB4658822.1 hypothetical protein [Parvularcula dongshanensis]
MKKILTATAAVCGMIGMAQAAEVTLKLDLGILTIDDSQFANTAAFVGSDRDASDVVDLDLTTSEPVYPGTDLSVGFTDNVLFNGDGYDLLVFEEFVFVDDGLSILPERMSATVGGQTQAGDFLGLALGVGVIDLATTYVYGFDLSDFGIGPGTTVFGDVLLSSLGLSPDVTEVLALNSFDASAVPVPAAALLFAPVALGGMALRRKKAV